MKKILLCTLLLLSITGIAVFAGCSSVAQADLIASPLVCTESSGYELYTYTAGTKDATTGIITEIGTLTFKWEKINGIRVEVGDYTNDAFSGIRFSYTLTVTENESTNTVNAVALCSNGFSPKYSYKKTVINGNEKVATVSYTSKYARTTLTENGTVTKKAKLNVKSAKHFDNEMLYSVIRASAVSSGSYSLSYSAPSALLGKLETMNITKTAKEDLQIGCINADEVTPCYKFNVTTANQYSDNYYLWIVQSPVAVQSETVSIMSLKKVIAQIEEGGYVYTLKSFEAK